MLSSLSGRVIPQNCGSGPPFVFSRLSTGGLTGGAENERCPIRSESTSDGR